MHNDLQPTHNDSSPCGSRVRDGSPRLTGMSEPHTPEEGRMVEDTDVRDGGVSIKTQATRNHLSIHV